MPEEKKMPNERKPEISRRSFLKLAGATAGLALGLRGKDALAQPVGQVASDLPAGRPAEIKERQASEAIIGVPFAPLTETEKTNFQEVFGTEHEEYAAIFPNVQFKEDGKFSGLPFEENSQAETLVEGLNSLTKDLQNAGGEPQIVMAVDMESGFIAPAVRTTAEIPAESMPADTYFFVDQTGLHYLKLTARPNGEEDKIQIIKVTPELVANVSQYQFNGKHVSIAPDAKWVLGQVAEDETIVNLISRDLAIFFVATTESSSPATPAPGQNPEPVRTPPAHEIGSQNLINLENYNGTLWPDEDMRISLDDTIQYTPSADLTSGQLTITSPDGDQRSFEVQSNGAHDQARVEDLKTHKRVSTIGVFDGILGTRILNNVQTVNPNTGEIIESLSFAQLEVVDIMVSVNKDGKQINLVLTLPKDQVGAATAGETPVFKDTDEWLATFKPGIKSASMLYVLPNGSWEDFLVNTILPIAQQRDLMSRQLFALMNLSEKRFIPDLQDLVAGSASGTIYVGPTYDLTRMT